MMNKNDRLSAALKKAASRGKKISCRRLFEIARRRDVGLRELGRVCDHEGIKISGCQLGCFE